MLSIPQGNHHTYDQIGGQSQNSGKHMISSDKNYHDHRSQCCNSNGGNGMRIKNFQKFNIRGDNGDQVPFVTTFQLRRAELTQNRKYLMADDRQKFKRDKMVTILLHIMKDTTEHRNQDHNGNDPFHRSSGKPGTLYNNLRNTRNPGTCCTSYQAMEDHLPCQDGQENGT